MAYVSLIAVRYNSTDINRNQYHDHFETKFVKIALLLKELFLVLSPKIHFEIITVLSSQEYYTLENGTNNYQSQFTSYISLQHFKESLQCRFRPFKVMLRSPL